MAEKKAAKAKTVQPTSIKVEQSLYKRVQHFKVESGKDVGEIIHEALVEYLKKHGA